MPEESASYFRDDMDVLLAVLFKVGAHSFGGQALMDAFDRAAREHGGIFARFRKKEGYDYSRKLEEAVSDCAGGSALVYLTPDFTLRPSEWAAGQYGENIFNKLSPEDRVIISRIADEVRGTTR